MEAWIEAAAKELSGEMPEGLLQIVTETFQRHHARWRAEAIEKLWPNLEFNDADVLQLVESQSPPLTVDEVKALLCSADSRRQYNQLCEGLTYRQREVLLLRHGLGQDHAYSLAETARVFKVTSERIRQIERRALDILCHSLAGRSITRQQEVENIRDKPVRDMHLGHRVWVACLRLGVNTVGELTEKTADDLMAIKNFGVTSLWEVRHYLQRYALSLKGDDAWES